MGRRWGEAHKEVKGSFDFSSHAVGVGGGGTAWEGGGMSMGEDKRQLWFFVFMIHCHELSTEDELRTLLLHLLFSFLCQCFIIRLFLGL